MAEGICGGCKRTLPLNKNKDCSTCADMKVKVQQVKSGNERTKKYFEGLRKLLSNFLGTDSISDKDKKSVRNLRISNRRSY